jgi:hypothetical protein
MPNLPGDLTTVTELFDQISVSRGGSAEIGGVWATDRNALIAEVTAQIVTFQTVNGRPVIDGVIDPNGGTLNAMNQLASAPGPGPVGGVSASVEPAPDGLNEAPGLMGIYVANPAQLTGTAPFDPIVVNAEYTRKLVSVTGSSIKWFGVVFPSPGGAITGSVPHINFTPTPIQGHYYDNTYETFTGWGGLWRDYTHVIGSQVAAAGVDHILVIPFYKTSQSANLGSFTQNWKEVVSAVITAAANSIDPLYLRDTFTFDYICSSSFSNGWVAHNQFATKGTDTNSLTYRIYDLDGAAGGSHWVPPNGIIYRNQSPPTRANPTGNIWYVGNRWSSQFKPIYGGGYVNGHAASRNHLLYPGLLLP